MKDIRLFLAQVAIIWISILFVAGAVGAQNGASQEEPGTTYLNPTSAPLHGEDDYCDLAVVECNHAYTLNSTNERSKTITATVTAYNTVEAQTDSTPCIAASGDNICGRQDVAACPRDIPLHTRITVDGRDYYCLDRTARKYDGRFDLSFDKDIRGALEFGKRSLEVTIHYE